MGLANGPGNAALAVNVNTLVVGPDGTVIGAATAIAVDAAGSAATTAADLVTAGQTAIALTALFDLAGDAIDTVLTGTAVATALDAIAGGSLGADDAAVQAVMSATYSATVANAVKASFDAVTAAFDDILAAQNSVDVLDVQATIIELENDGTNVAMATGATEAATANDDLIGYVTDLDNSVVIGSAAQAFGANGDDALIIAGEYTFSTITEAQSDAIATVSLGDSSALEIFVYQDATSGDAVLHVERTAGEGNVEGTTMSTITLTDVTFADLGQVVADDVTVLTSAAVIA